MCSGIWGGEGCLYFELWALWLKGTWVDGIYIRYMYIRSQQSNSRHMIVHYDVLPLILLALEPKQRLLLFQYFKNVGYRFAFAVIRYRHITVINACLFAIIEIMMAQRVDSCDSILRIEAKHGDNEI